jgi:hypothetical protein
VAWMDAPLLDELNIKLTSHQRFDTETSQLTQFICRTPKFKAYRDGEARGSLYKGGMMTSRSHLSKHLMECLSWESHTGSQIGSFVSDTFLWLILPSGSYFHGGTPFVLES